MLHDPPRASDRGWIVSSGGNRTARSSVNNSCVAGTVGLSGIEHCFIYLDRWITMNKASGLMVIFVDCIVSLFGLLSKRFGFD